MGVSVRVFLEEIMIWIRLSRAEQMVPVSVGGHHCLLRAVIVQKGGGSGDWAWASILFFPGTCALLILGPSDEDRIFPPASCLPNLHIKYYRTPQFPKSYELIPVIYFLYVYHWRILTNITIQTKIIHPIPFNCLKHLLVHWQLWFLWRFENQIQMPDWLDNNQDQIG